MTTPTIPRGMQPVVSGYGFGAPDGVIRTAVAGGAPRNALDWDRGVQPFQVTIVLDSAEKFGIWNVFFLQAIKKGAISFNMPLDSGFGLSPHLVTIVPGTYSAVVNKKFAIVSFTVEAESQAYQFDDDAAAVLLELYESYGDQTGRFFDRLAVFANSDTDVLDFGL